MLRVNTPYPFLTVKVFVGRHSLGDDHSLCDYMYFINCTSYQWRIQDFPDGGEGGANPQGGDTKILFGQFFPENCIKMKEIGPTRGACVPAPLPQIHQWLQTL